MPTASTDLPERGEIWLVALGAVRIGEPGKTRPCVLLSPGELLRDDPADLVSVVPVSSSAAPSLLRVALPANVGLDRDSLAICRAVRSLARSRLLRKVGRVPAAAMVRIDEAIEIALGLDGRPDRPGVRPPEG